MKRIQDALIKEGDKVILRVDFNVSVEDGKPKELFKLMACKESLKYLLLKGAKVGLMTYFGRPDGKIVSEMSLGQLADDLEKILNQKIIFVDECVGQKVKDAINNLSKGEVLLMENVRFHEEEEQNDPDFSRALSENFDIFVNEAFSQSHRNQASVTGVTKFLPSYAGFWLQKEVESLFRVMNNPERPAVAIIGGAKIETKLPLIKKFEEIYNTVLVGGKIANEAIDAGMTFSEKVVLPVDFAEERADIGPKSIKLFVEKIKTAKTVVWNGPMGKFEQSKFTIGTDAVLEAIIGTDVFSVMGGGESVQLLEEKGVMNKVSFVSTGGGAMLEFLSGKLLPGIEALKK